MTTCVTIKNEGPGKVLVTQRETGQAIEDSPKLDLVPGEYVTYALYLKRDIIITEVK